MTAFTAQAPEPTLLVERFIARAQSAPDSMALAVYPTGALEPSALLSWGEWHAAARAMAADLIVHGVARGERVAVHSGNTPLWPIADMALQMIGAIGVGIFPSSTEGQVAAIMAHSGAVLMLGADEDWRARVARGRVALADDREVGAELDARLAALAPTDLAAIIYTSGSTGRPKGACISHRYLAASTNSTLSVLGLSAHDRGISFLPFSHAAERVFGQGTRIGAGMATALIEDPSDLFPVAARFAPTFLAGLPRIFERLYEAIEVTRRDGGDPRTRLAQLIGPHCRTATSGGAAMPTHIAETLRDLGLTILGAYGQTEHLCIAMNRPDHLRFDAVGAPMPGTTIRITEDGELLVQRSALTFSGYWNMPIETAQAFTDDGEWLRTGDLVRQDADGMLRLTGRRRDLIALSTGRKVAPSPIEAALSASPYVAHALCHGEGRKFLTALMSPRRAVVEAFARETGLTTPWPALLAEPPVRALFQAAVDAVNADLARTDRVQRFAITADEFTTEGGELTSTLKLVRATIAARYAADLDALYATVTS